MSLVRMSLFNTITGKTRLVDLPHRYYTVREAYKAIDFLSNLGGQWGDHDSVDSHPIHVSYHAVPLGNELN